MCKGIYKRQTEKEKKKVEVHRMRLISKLGVAIQGDKLSVKMLLSFFLIYIFSLQGAYESHVIMMFACLSTNAKQ